MTTTRDNLRFAIIGAGMSGILAAIRLRQAGYAHIAVYEKADRLGGTWRENTYPGLSCDVPSHFYSYSFALNPEWSHRYAGGAEILAYFEDVATRFGVEPLVHYGKEVTCLSFEADRWRIATTDGVIDEADFVIAATGVLHHPNYPDIPGLESFAGPCFHSARWDHGVPLENERIGIVGTGSSAIQIVTALAGRVRTLHLFQRTAQWIAPSPNPAYTEDEKAAFRASPDGMLAIREETSRAFIDGFANVLIDASSPMLQAIHAGCEAFLDTSVRDPVLREKLRPNYRAACKRLIISDGFYVAIQHPTSTLVTEKIARIEPGGIRTVDGALHELDVLVLATGFKVDAFVRPITVLGREGAVLDRVWAAGPHAHLAVDLPDFPNFFMLNGPNGPVGNFSLIEVAELQMGYVLELIDLVRRGVCDAVSPTPAAMARFDSERRAAAANTIWASGCKSWYLDASGLPTAWPFTWDRFRAEMQAPRLEDYDLARDDGGSRSRSA